MRIAACITGLERTLFELPVVSTFNKHVRDKHDLATDVHLSVVVDDQLVATAAGSALTQRARRAFHAASVELVGQHATERYIDGRPLEAVMPAANPKPGHWPRCGMATHGVNTAQAIKTAAVLWRFDADPRLKRLNDERMGRIDEKYGVATGLFCADESLCAAPWDTEANRKSPSRGTELCSVVESMYSYNGQRTLL